MLVQWIGVFNNILTDNVEDYELEEYMAEILNNEFDTIAEDGSISKVSCSIHLLHMVVHDRDQSFEELSYHFKNIKS